MSSERPDLAEYTRLRGFTYQAKERQQLPPSFRIDFASPLEPSSPVGNGLEVVHFPAEFPHQGSYIEGIMSLVFVREDSALPPPVISLFHSPGSMNEEPDAHMLNPETVNMYFRVPLEQRIKRALDKCRQPFVLSQQQTEDLNDRLTEIERQTGKTYPRLDFTGEPAGDKPSVLEWQIDSTNAQFLLPVSLKVEGEPVGYILEPEVRVSPESPPIQGSIYCTISSDGKSVLLVRNYRPGNIGRNEGALELPRGSAEVGDRDDDPRELREEAPDSFDPESCRLVSQSLLPYQAPWAGQAMVNFLTADPSGKESFSDETTAAWYPIDKVLRTMLERQSWETAEGDLLSTDTLTLAALIKFAVKEGVIFQNFHKARSINNYKRVRDEFDGLSLVVKAEKHPTIKGQTRLSLPSSEDLAIVDKSSWKIEPIEFWRKNKQDGVPLNPNTSVCMFTNPLPVVTYGGVQVLIMSKVLKSPNLLSMTIQEWLGEIAKEDSRLDAWSIVASVGTLLRGRILNIKTTSEEEDLEAALSDYEASP